MTVYGELSEGGSCRPVKGAQGAGDVLLVTSGSAGWPRSTSDLLNVMSTISDREAGFRIFVAACAGTVKEGNDQIARAAPCLAGLNIPAFSEPSLNLFASVLDMST
jgi:hypothetical protein